MIRVDWATIKQQALMRKLPLQCVTKPEKYSIALVQGNYALSCNILRTDPASAAQIDFEENFLSGANKNIVSNVITALEEDNKSLCLASVESTFNESDEAVLEILIPGTPGEVGRFIKDGYAFTDTFVWGIRVISAALIDKNFMYAGSLYPATPTEAEIPGVEGMSWADVFPTGVSLADYCDTGVPTENLGWRLWAEEGGQGGVEINSLAGYGNLLSGCYLRIVITRPAGNTTVTRVCCNLEWGSPK